MTALLSFPALHRPCLFSPQLCSPLEQTGNRVIPGQVHQLRGGAPFRIFHGQSRASLDEQADDFHVTLIRCKMKRGATPPVNHIQPGASAHEKGKDLMVPRTGCHVEGGPTRGTVLTGLGAGMKPGPAPQQLGGNAGVALPWSQNRGASSSRHSACSRRAGLKQVADRIGVAVYDRTAKREMARRGPTVDRCPVVEVVLHCFEVAGRKPSPHMS